jgi:predicted ATPase with chaperone activity
MVRADANKQGKDNRNDFRGPAMLAELAVPQETQFFGAPAERLTFESTGLREDLLLDLVLKMIQQRGPQTGYQLADHLRLSLTAIQDNLAEQRRLHILEVLGSDKSAFGEGAYIYHLTDEGRERAKKALARCGYVGAAPIPFDEYVTSVWAQSVRGIRVDEAQLVARFDDLVLSARVFDEVGPAVNAASSVFFYGASGNGKTSIATRLVRLLGDPIFVPYAIEVESSIIEFFDPVVHTVTNHQSTRFDRRWVQVERPAVIAGGELTADQLDLHFNQQRRTYQPPYQMKANCGMFLIDDFGRQAMSPHHLLNRLIVPLEQKTDYLTLMTGTKMEVPFDEIVVFSTNLVPAELADEAFLRRIKYKIHLQDPTLEEFREIFLQQCPQFGVQFDDRGFEYLVNTHYRMRGRSFRAVHPRDLLDQMQALGRYKGIVPIMDEAMMDAVVRTYFAD